MEHSECQQRRWRARLGQGAHRRGHQHHEGCLLRWHKVPELLSACPHSWSLFECFLCLQFVNSFLHNNRANLVLGWYHVVAIIFAFGGSETVCCAPVRSIWVNTTRWTSLTWPSRRETLRNTVMIELCECPNKIPSSWTIVFDKCESHVQLTCRSVITSRTMNHFVLIYIK